MKKILLSACLMAIVFMASAQKQKQEKTPEPPQQQQQQQVDTASYYIIGSIDQFRLLYAAINTPDNITRGQAQQLTQWVNTVRALLPEKPANTKSK